MLLVIAALVISVNSPYGRFKQALKQQNFTTAIALYEKNSNNEYFTDKAQTYLKKYINDMTDNFSNGKMTYEDVNDAFKIISPYAEIEDAQAATKTIASVEKSREAFSAAEKNMSGEAFEEAISNYKLVVSEDKSNYTVAQNKIADAKKKLCQKAIEQADTELNANDAIAAFTTLNAVQEEYRNEEVLSLIAKVKEKATTQAEKQISSNVNAGSYKQACEIVFRLPTELASESLDTLKKQAEDGLIGQVDAKKSAGEYDAAIALLVNDNGTIIDNSLVNELNDCTKGKNIKSLQTLKQGLHVKYDSINKMYSIFAGDTISKTVNTLPQLVVGESNTMYMITLGFVANNWIFMDSILVDCDGTQYNIDVDYSNRKTHVSYGGIGEMYTVADQNSIVDGMSISSGNIEQSFDLSSVVTSMSNANKITIRFQGSGGKKDIIVSKQEVAQINAIWEIYQILKNDPSLIAYLK